MSESAATDYGRQLAIRLMEYVHAWRGPTLGKKRYVRS